MLLFLLITASFVNILCRPALESVDFPINDDVDRYFLYETNPGVYVLEDLLEGEIDTRTAPQDLTYYFYSHENPQEGIPIKSSNIVNLKKTSFTKRRDTVFIIHGHRGSHESSFNHEMKDSIMKHNNVNAFIVDWEPIANRFYGSAAMSVSPVGKLIGDFIDSLVNQYRIRLSKVILVGFSLGAHVAGNVGAALNGEVDQIIGLDPAGPLFYKWNVEARLNPSHGKYVHVIHTNALRYGYYFLCGHSDYYANGGGRQPGCDMPFHWSCSHHRAYQYYVESNLGQNQFIARKCSGLIDYELGLCNENPTSVLGGYPVDKSANGTYYLDTSAESPFAMGLRKKSRGNTSTTSKL